MENSPTTSSSNQPDTSSSSEKVSSNEKPQSTIQVPKEISFTPDDMMVMEFSEFQENIQKF